MSGLEDSYNAVQLKMSTVLSISHAFIPNRQVNDILEGYKNSD
ncbi:hypothetical protein V6C56_11855 (plasmid) [Staphylococcus capitis subsp. urealyticus]|nr:hypothetical protein [Staphylococcus capitis]MDS3995551.1 hypothetical protein [Staphylococcus capitis]